MAWHEDSGWPDSLGLISDGSGDEGPESPQQRQPGGGACNGAGSDTVVATAAPFNAGWQGVGEGDAGKMTVDEKRMRIRRLDVARKKIARRTTKSLVKTLWEIETEARRTEKPVLRARGIKRLKVLEEVVRRLKIVTGRQPRELLDGGMAWSGGGGLSSVMAGMEGARSVGVMYVCLEDWVVRRSNVAMGLVCPFEAMRGYVGLELPGVVHPDDHLQLLLLHREQAWDFKSGDSLVLSVRMLRACVDRGTLVLQCRRQILEVSHVGRDAEHGGKMHMLFTCVLDPDSLVPLTFDDSDRADFQESASIVSGAMIMDPTRTTESMDEISKKMSEIGIRGRTEASPIASLLAGLSRSVGRTLGVPELLGFLKRETMSMVNGAVRTHALLGLGPDGTPRVQMSAKLCAFGLSSPFHIFACASLSGRPCASMPGAGNRQSIFGVLKLPASQRGRSIGLVSVGLAGARDGGQERARRIVTVVEAIFNHDDAGGVHEKTWVLHYSKERNEVIPTKDEIHTTRMGPPDPALLHKFMLWDKGQERMTAPFPEFQ